MQWVELGKWGDHEKAHAITQGVATRIGNKLWTETDYTLDYFPEYLNGSHQYQFPNVSRIAAD